MKNKTLVNKYLKAFTDKEHRQHDHIEKSEEAEGKSPEEADKIGWATVNKEKTAAKDPCWEGYEMAGTKKKNGKTVPNCIPKKSALLINNYLKKEAAGVQVGPGSGGNYNMGVGVNTTPNSTVQAPTSTPQAFNPTVDRLNKKRKKVDTNPRYTAPSMESRRTMNPDTGTFKKVVPNKNTPDGYDKSPLTDESLRSLYPSLYGEEKPSQLSRFTQWLKDLHNKYFGESSTAPMAAEAANTVRIMVKTALSESNEYEIVLQALNELGISTRDIIKALA